MFQYRQVLVRLRAGDSEREIARLRLMGRDKLASFRALATAQGWLDATTALPDDATIAAALGEVRRARTTISSVEPYRDIVEGTDHECFRQTAFPLCRAAPSETDP